MTDWRANLVDDDPGLAAILAATRLIAVVGMKEDSAEVSHRIPAYMQAHGYRILAVNPKVAASGRTLLGEPAFANLCDLDVAARTDRSLGPVDMVNVFRGSDNVPAHADEALLMQPPPRVFWMQLGIHHAAAAERLARAGVKVVQNRCVLVEHGRLGRSR